MLSQVPVAVKCLSKDKVKSQLNDFVLEAKNMCSVDHGHIVQLYGVVLGSDTLMLVRCYFTHCLLYRYWVSLKTFYF